MRRGVADDLEPQPLAIGPLVVEHDCSEARLGPTALALTFAQRKVLLVLLRRGGRVGRRRELYEEAFGRALPPGSRAVDGHVARIRRALGSYGRAIVSVDRVGYRIDVDALRGQVGDHHAAESRTSRADRPLGEC